MRRMINFTPVAHGEIDSYLEKFVLDNPLQLNATYYIVFDDGAGHQYSTWLTTDNDTSYAGYITFESDPVSMMWSSTEPQYLQLSLTVEDEGALAKVIRIN